jgi:hypothetical protein
MNDNLKIALDELGVDFINELTNQLLAADKKATGQLISSLNYKVVDVLDNLLLTISAEPYLKFIDEGRKPGKMPPSQVFFKWIDARGIVFKNNKGKIIKKESTAFLIARSIGKKGIKPTNVIRKTIDKIYSTKTQLLEKAAAKDIVALIQKILVT